MNHRLVAIAGFIAVLLTANAAGAQPPPEGAAPPPPAGVVPAEVVLDVTGTPAADAAFLDTQIRNALERRIRPALAAGASITYGPVVPWPLLPLGFGSRAAVNVTVTVAGDNTTSPVSGVTNVVLNSMAVPPPAPDVLFLSDDPEYLQSEGLIFRGNVAPDGAARLYYYHSDTGVPRDLDIALTADVPSRVHLIHSQAGPDLDVMSAGHKVSRDFLQFQRDDEGIVVDVVPGVPFIVRHALLLQGEVVAGAVDVHVLRGGVVGVSVVGSAAGSRPDQYLRGPRVPYDGHRRHGTFDLTRYGSSAQTYSVGGPPAAVRYGARVPTPHNLDVNDDGRDLGDYGVVHRVTLTLVNPTDDPHVVYLYEKPLGGPARGSFLIDGQLRELGCVRLPQAYWLATYQLAPHSTGASTTLTMPDGGSFYPVEFGASDVQPVPYTPPVGSADGCSPNAPAFPDALR